MLVKFKKDYIVTIDGLDDRYVDNTFVFKKDKYYCGHIFYNNLIIEDSYGDTKIKLNQQQIKEYIY